MFWSTLSIKIHKVLKISIWWMIKWNLLEFSFVWNFHNKIMCWIYSDIFCNSKIRVCDKKKRIFNFPPLINNSGTKGLRFLLLIISTSYHQIQSIFFIVKIPLMFFIWIVFFNIFINIIHIIWVFNKSCWIIKIP